MFAIATVSSLLGYGLLLNRFFKWPLESTFLLVGSSIILLLYFAGLSDSLELSAQVLMGLGIALFVVLMVTVIKEKKIVSLASPGAIFFLVGVLLLWGAVNSDYYSYFTEWDDFAGWARTSKVIYFNNGLVQASDPVWSMDYPPGTSLFHYYVFQASGFSAPSTFFAQGVLILAACSQLLVVLPRGRWIALVLCSLFYCFMIYYFGPGFHTLSVDLLLGLIFGAGVSAYWLSDRSFHAVIRVIPLVLVLPVIKMMGMAFASIIIAIIVFDQIRILVLEKKGGRSFFLALLMIPLLFLMHASWQHHFDGLGVNSTFNPDISVEKVINSFNPGLATERQKTTIRNFVERVTTSKSIELPLLLFLMASILLIYWERGCSRGRGTGIHLFFLLAGLVSYLLLLLISYMFFFGEYEGIRLASFSRYLGTYIVGMTVILFSMLTYQYLNKERGRYIVLGFLLLFSLLSIKPGVGAIKQLSAVEARGVDGIVRHVSSYASTVTEKVPENKKVFFIWQNSNGYQMQMFSYGIIPRITNRGCWSVGEKYYDGDVWTCPMDTKGFSSYISGYDYLFVAHADKFFWNRFALLFKQQDTGDGHLYKIVKTENKLSLISVGL
ncbi:hypothetical protein [Mariprofundus ferrooxydans]|uniref:hypothetical protein n=1 Tax=Mariprofundus ferrooxydans TaxID=314344 RepID=UPI0003711543|nr:hypothetical protein [Mariprofundus ferrooxydans]